MMVARVSPKDCDLLVPLVSQVSFYLDRARPHVVEGTRAVH